MGGNITSKLLKSGLIFRFLFSRMTRTKFCIRAAVRRRAGTEALLVIHQRRRRF
jgi:hypothetical protein